MRMMKKMIWNKMKMRVKRKQNRKRKMIRKTRKKKRKKRLIKNSTSNFQRAWKSVALRMMLTAPRFPNSFDLLLLNPGTTKSVWIDMSTTCLINKNPSFTLLVRISSLSRSFLVYKCSWRKTLKFWCLLTLLMSNALKNSPIMMERNSSRSKNRMWSLMKPKMNKTDLRKCKSTTSLWWTGGKIC